MIYSENLKLIPVPLINFVNKHFVKMAVVGVYNSFKTGYFSFAKTNTAMLMTKPKIIKQVSRYLNGFWTKKKGMVKSVTILSRLTVCRNYWRKASTFSVGSP